MKASLITLILCTQFCWSQISFQKFFGGSSHDFGHAVEQTSDGGYILIGQTNSFGPNQDIYLVKTDELGNEIWSKTYDSGETDWGISAKQTSDGGYILCGGWNGATSDSLVLIKTNSTGDVLWNYRFSGSIDREVGQSVIETSDGGFAACGFTGPFPYEDIFVVKTNSLGTLEWSKVFSGSLKEIARTIRQTSDDGYFILGSTNSRGYGEDDLYLLRLNAIGDTLWTKTYGTSLSEVGSSMCINSDGSIALIGYEYFNGGNIYVVKVESNGTIIWEEYYGGSGWDIGYSIKQTSDDGFVLAGRFDNTSVSGNHEMYCVKLNDSGNIQWENTYPAGIMSDAACVQQTLDGGYILFGTRTSEVSFDSDMVLVKVPANGLLELECLSENVNLNAYPNPFNDQITIEIKSLKSTFDITLTDINGKVLKHIQNVSSKIILQTESLPSGIIFISISADEHIIARGKIIKN